ncbi:MAG: signal peptidase I [Methanomassiliicoccus sp.]|nr:signal peptidase I [Methanomassiliicoccus sp.]
MKPRPGQLGTAVLAVLLALALAGVLAPAFGWRLDVVQTGSMSPSIGVGDLVVTSPADPGDIEAGDVISFRSEGALVCHRVVSVDRDDGAFVTRGDANEGPDPSPVAYGDVLGKVVLDVPYLGHVISFLKSPFGWALIILLALLVLVAGGEEKRSKKNEDRGEGRR